MPESKNKKHTEGDPDIASEAITDTEPETDTKNASENENAENPEAASEIEDAEDAKATSKDSDPEDTEEEAAKSKHPDEELEVLSDLWDLAVRAPNLSPDLVRQMTPFAKFRKMPARGQEIIREALDLDGDFREKVLEEWQKNSAEFENEHIAAMALLWLSRPPRWRDEVDRFVMMHSKMQTLTAENKDMQVKLRQAETEQQRVKNLQDKRKKKAAKTKSQSEKDQLKRVQAESQAERLAGDYEAAKETIRNLETELRSESEGLSSLQRHHDKLRKTLSKREQRINQLEREVRHLKNPEAEETPDERRRGFTKDEIWGDALVPQEPRLPITPPQGVSQFSRTAAEHYVKKTAVVFVDGYNFIFIAWPDETEHLRDGSMKNSGHKPGLEVFRNRLIDKSLSLEARFRPYNLDQICLVFDGKYPGPQAEYPPQSGIQVVFSPPDKIADDVIVKRLSEYPSSKQIAVVSDDQELRSRCYDEGATIMSVTQLLHLFE